MKNKKILIIIGVVVTIVLLFWIVFNVLISKGMGISTGVYLETKNGVSILVREKTPIQMSNRTDKELFNDLDIGDKMLVIHTGIEESYPAKTGVYAVFKIKEGTTGNIPTQVVEELVKLGWLESEEVH